MNTSETVKQILAKLDCCRKSAAEILPSDQLRYQLGLDSLGIIECLTALEDTFGIQLSDDDLMKQEEWMQTVESLTEFIGSKLPV